MSEKTVIQQHQTNPENIIFTYTSAATNLETMTADRVYLRPFDITGYVYVDRIAVIWATTAVGNAVVGIYTDNGNTPVGGTVVVESGSVAKSGGNRIQEITITSTLLVPGKYWVAVVSDEATSMFVRANSRFSTGATRGSCYYAIAIYPDLDDPCPSITSSALYMFGGYLRVTP